MTILVKFYLTYFFRCCRLFFNLRVLNPPRNPSQPLPWSANLQFDSRAYQMSRQPGALLLRCHSQHGNAAVHGGRSHIRAVSKAGIASLQGLFNSNDCSQ